MIRIARSVFVAIALVGHGCGGRTSSTPSAPTAPSNVLSVAGTYPTRATLNPARNTCGDVTVQDFPTTVTHTPGGTEVTLIHAGSTYRGSVDARGRFSTPPANFPFPDADYLIGIAGQFTTTGLTAEVHLVRRNGATTCEYDVNWVGTKQGSPNTIPS